MDLNLPIQEHLLRWLNDHIYELHESQIEHQWSGILGVGKEKYPIIKRHSADMILALRLGAMGVAIGTEVGKKAVELL